MLDNIIWAPFVCDVAQLRPGISLLVGIGVVCNRGGQRCSVGGGGGWCVGIGACGNTVQININI